MAERESWTGLTDAEAKELHEVYLAGMFLFAGVAVVAHILVWFWRSWIPGPDGYAMIEDATRVLAQASSLIG